MLITASLDIATSRSRSGSSKVPAMMQDNRTPHGKASGVVSGQSVAGRPATDFSIEAIMGRNSEETGSDKASPQLLASYGSPSSSPLSSGKT